MTNYTDGPLEPEDEAATEGRQDPTLSADPEPADEGIDRPTDEPAQ